MSTARTIPVWMSINTPPGGWSDLPSAKALDVAVVGAGIAGLTTALALLREGRQVTVIEREGVGAGETLRTSAHLSNALDDRYYTLARQHGEDGAKLAAASHAAAIDFIESLCRDSVDGCGFQRIPGYLFGHDGDVSQLEKEAEAANAAGVRARLIGAGDEAPAVLGPLLRFEQQARIDIGAYMRHLAQEVRDAGGRFVRAEVTNIEGGSTCRIVFRDGSTISAQTVVAATNVPIHETNATYMKQAPYRSYVVAGEAPSNLADALYWDTADAYHYVRLFRDGDGKDWIIVGGEDHKTGQDDDPTAYVRLQEWTRERFPDAGPFTHAWSGQIIEPVDGMAFIGADPDNDNVFLITGDSGNGLTHGTLGALLVCDLVQGRDNPWTQLYDPARKPVRAAGEWIRENANAAFQFRDWLKPSAIGDADDIPLGGGAVLRRGVHRVAVYRSGDGELHAFNARCPHMGCVVRWSGEEKSWDCPCHGSRFEGATGAILNGPTSEPLAPMEWKE
ncbi:FAD-dependent oxidoreductase [Lysobacter auxotrophicus]|uniref:FAD-dependent oxidoreductase n=1 Tax=Lysobacter auxotrophicus TaxID=2992573 RepID=A0ABM8DCY3_9GAMM|nr:FAD-dependent oxidoreductase [Lysobacter auxotrophicus]BDU16395.1 FAD-dependent oxidoreductase [Lysobacter auxotrophicus]